MKQIQAIEEEKWVTFPNHKHVLIGDDGRIKDEKLRDKVEKSSKKKYGKESLKDRAIKKLKDIYNKLTKRR